jgi:hypothetical protein
MSGAHTHTHAHAHTHTHTHTHTLSLSLSFFHFVRALFATHSEFDSLANCTCVISSHCVCVIQNNTMIEELSASIEKSIDAEAKSLANFEKDFKRRHAQLLADLAKAEKESAKAGKKSPAQLQEV